jgi:FkbM family methyltransferase
MIHKFDKPFEFFRVHKIEINSALDIGAHKGTWTAEFKKHYPDAKQLMIEANADHIDDLIRIGHYILALVGKTNDEVDYYVCDDKQNNHGNGIYKENTNVPFKKTTRRCTTLDSLLPGQKFDLIKMDVQGAELDIIQGSPGMIHQAKYLWLELQPHNYNIGAPSAGKVIGYLNQIGFEMVTIDEVNMGNGVIMGMDVIFVNTRNKDLKTGYDINRKIIWSGYSQ